MADPEDLVSVYQGANVTEAHLVMNLLLEQGIEASVSEENEPLAGLSIVPPDVLVKRADEVRARAVIDAMEDDQIRRAERAEWKCPKCAATVEGSFDFCDVCGADRPAN